MGALKRYLLQLVCAVAPEGGKVQDDVEVAVLSGRMRITGNLEQDVKILRDLKCRSLEAGSHTQSRDEEEGSLSATITDNLPTLIGYPARPINGGPPHLALPKSGRWGVEAKYNGWCAMIHGPTGRMWNRQGHPLSIQSEFARALAKLKDLPFAWLHVEALERRHPLGRGTLIVLDAPVTGTYEQRRHGLSQFLPLAPEAADQIASESLYLSYGLIVDQSNGVAARDLYARLEATMRANNARVGCDFYEGLVCKKADSLYPIQLLSPEKEFPYWIKHRFI